MTSIPRMNSILLSSSMFSRENVMKQAISISNLELDMLLPGIRLNNSANNYSPIGQLRMMRFNGVSWELFGEVLAE